MSCGDDAKVWRREPAHSPGSDRAFPTRSPDLGGHIVFRRTAHRREPRGLFCGIGVCFDCLVVIDGQPGRRACMIEVRDGMHVMLQRG